MPLCDELHCCIQRIGRALCVPQVQPVPRHHLPALQPRTGEPRCPVDGVTYQWPIQCDHATGLAPTHPARTRLPDHQQSKGGPRGHLGTHSMLPCNNRKHGHPTHTHPSSPTPCRQVLEFQKVLWAGGRIVHVRHSKGDSGMAACGQLGDVGRAGGQEAGGHRGAGAGEGRGRGSLRVGGARLLPEAQAMAARAMRAGAEAEGGVVA